MQLNYGCNLSALFYYRSIVQNLSLGDHGKHSLRLGELSSGVTASSGEVGTGLGLFSTTCSYRSHKDGNIAVREQWCLVSPNASKLPGIKMNYPAYV